MAKDIDTLIRSLPKKRQRKIKARTEELIAIEMNLRELRSARELTQEAVAELLDIGQDSVSRLEARSDYRVSTLRSYIEALGGKLRIIAELPDMPPIELTEDND